MAKGLIVEIFGITLLFMILAILLMAVGVIFTGKSLKGSCGGLGKIMGVNCDNCEKKNECKSK